MKKSFCAAVLLAMPLAGNAMTVDTTTSPLSLPDWSTVKTYTIVYLDPRKLRIPAATALAQWPNEECLAPEENNGPFNCPGMNLDGALTYPITDGLGYPDPKDPRKSLRIDGLKQKRFANFVSPAACTLTACPPVSTPAPLNLTFTHPVTRFAMHYRFNWDGNGNWVQWSNAIDIVVNGQDMGTFPSYLLPGGAMVSVAAAPGETISTISFIPVSVTGQVPGPILGDMFWYN